MWPSVSCDLGGDPPSCCRTNLPAPGSSPIGAYTLDSPPMLRSADTSNAISTSCLFHSTKSLPFISRLPSERHWQITSAYSRSDPALECCDSNIPQVCAPPPARISRRTRQVPWGKRSTPALLACERAPASLASAGSTPVACALVSIQHARQSAEQARLQPLHAPSTIVTEGVVFAVEDFPRDVPLVVRSSDSRATAARRVPSLKRASNARSASVGWGGARTAGAEIGGGRSYGLIVIVEEFFSTNTSPVFACV